ncbi:bifunctional metallophosphatase/5'-nucleotidase [Shewanella maritima]|uniref:bifunctional metallophosphatase/5'-nucleotidase n=1 Tax=Shewanella maritima TaxID=2520507 RepID=UPI00373504EC
MTQTYSLKLAHINDTHSHFDPTQVRFSLQHSNQQFQVLANSGGYARIGYQVEQARQQANDNQQAFVFLHGGDSFQGTLYFREFQGAANAHLLNLLKPDAMVLGNHEIDAGNSPVQAFLNRIDFPMLAGNMDLSQEDRFKPGRLYGHPMLYDYDDTADRAKVLIKPFHDQKLAIVGITLDQMRLIARPDADTHFANAIDTLEHTIANLHQQGIKHILVLSHLGLEQDKELAEKVSGISLIVGGHSHTLQGDFSQLGMSNMPYGERVNDVPILHAGKYAETIGLADITFDEQGKVTELNGCNYFMLSDDLDIQSEQKTTQATLDEVKKHVLTHKYVLGAESNSEVDDVIAADYRPALQVLENNILAHIPKDFIHTRLPSKHFPHGSEIAPWVSRSMYKSAKQIEPNLDFALHNAGGVRQSLIKGQLSMADVVGRILPFELPLTLYQIQGKYIIQAIESAINAATNNGVTGTGAGSFPYPYGLRYFYDGTRPMGQRVTQVQVLRQKQWQDMGLETNYIGVSTAYTAAGKEGYDALLFAQWQQGIDTKTLPEAFVDFVSEHSHLIGDKLLPNVNYISHHQ